MTARLGVDGWFPAPDEAGSFDSIAPFPASLRTLILGRARTARSAANVRRGQRHRRIGLAWR